MDKTIVKLIVTFFVITFIWWIIIFIWWIFILSKVDNIDTNINRYCQTDIDDK